MCARHVPANGCSTPGHIEPLEEMADGFPVQPLNPLHALSFAPLTPQEKEAWQLMDPADGPLQDYRFAGREGTRDVWLNSLGTRVYRTKIRLGSGPDAVVIEALLDCGAGVNCMKKSVFERLPTQLRQALTRSRTTVVTACTTTMQSEGTVSLPTSFLSTDGKSWLPSRPMTKLEVMHRLNFDFIVGAPGLEDWDMVMDFSTKSVHVRDRKGDLLALPLLDRMRNKDTRTPITSAPLNLLSTMGSSSKGHISKPLDRSSTMGGRNTSLPSPEEVKESPSEPAARSPSTPSE